MSITSEIRSYADTAVSQGKQVLGQAQTQLNDVTGQANEYVGKFSASAKENLSVLTEKATTVANDLRAQAEKAVNLEALKAAIEPYLAQAKDYRAAVTDRAEAVLVTLKKDERVAKVVETAKPVVDVIQERVVKPARSLANRTPVAKPAASKPAATKPASTRPAAAKPAPAKAARATARKAPAKRASKA
jgi:ABC-type sugar transport system ATPase subunit